MKVAFCSAEVFPLVKVGGLADVCGALPLALEKIGIDVSIFMPDYRIIDKKRFSFTPVKEGLQKICLGKNINVYLVGNDDFFQRDGIYGEGQGDYKDNFDRFHYFCRKSLQLMKELNLDINIVHCHDWHTALIPLILKELAVDDRYYQNLKTVLTIHNLAYQGQFSFLFPKTFFDFFKDIFSRNRNSCTWTKYIFNSGFF